MTVLSKTFKRRMSATEPINIACENCEYDRLCFILVLALRVKIRLGPRPPNKILVPFRDHFQKIRRTPPSLLYGSPPPPGTISSSVL